MHRKVSAVISLKSLTLILTMAPRQCFITQERDFVDMIKDTSHVSLGY